METLTYDDRAETRNEKGQLHSFNGEPAVSWKNGDKAWYKAGLPHKLGSPAMVWANGRSAWFYKGKRVLPSEAFNEFLYIQEPSWLTIKSRCGRV